MSATSRLNICNIEKIMVATSKNLDLILKHSHETLAICQEHGCNMRTMICNINEKRLYHEDDRLQHIENIITTSIYNNRNIKKIPKIGAGKSSPLMRPPRRQELLHPPSSRRDGPPSSYAVGELPCPVAGSFALDAGELRAEADARTPGRKKLRLSELHHGRSFHAVARSTGNVPTTLDLT
jgi:hypothetical protein